MSFLKFTVRPLLRRLLMIVVIMPQLGGVLHAGWETQWIERFDGAGVDWTNWTAQIQANYNNEVQCYTDDDSSLNKNYDVSGGTLKIIARKQNISCPGLGNASKSWTSGRLNSKDKQEFLFGRIEARIRFLNTEGGTWPAFWMLENRIAENPIAGDGDNINWPNPGAGEIDVWEWFSNNPSSYITNFFNTSSCGSEVRYSYPGGVNDVLQWHDYAMEWDANTIRFFVDDIQVTSHNISGCAQYKEPMFILLNVAMGGNLGGAIDPGLNQATMEVDYVAHCTETNSNSATRCNQNTPSGSGAAIDDLIIFENFERPDWAAWDSTGGTNPGLVIDNDPLKVEAMEFMINGSTVVGFTARSPAAVGGMAFDASSFETNGSLEFDLKMLTSPGVVDWKLRVESSGMASEVEVSLSSSNEGHGAPLQDVWQHYSFNLSTLKSLGLDIANIDLVLIFPQYGLGDNAVYRIDNLVIRNNAPQAAPVNAPPVITSISDLFIVAGKDYRYQLLASDPEGDVLTLSTIRMPVWLEFNRESGLLTGTPTSSDIGSHRVELEISDGSNRIAQGFTLVVLRSDEVAVTDVTSSSGGGGIELWWILLLSCFWLGTSITRKIPE